MDNKESNRKMTIIGLSLIVLAICIFLSLISTLKLPDGQLGSPATSGHDTCSVNYNLSEDSDNIIGVVGDSFHCFLRYKGFGLVSIIIPIIILLV